MARHRGKFNPNNDNPYELSRSAVETFIKCKACFWLEKKAGVKPPEIPSFTLNTTTDILLKRDADAVRGLKSLPLWEANDLGLLVDPASPLLENAQCFVVIHEDSRGLQNVERRVQLAHMRCKRLRWYDSCDGFPSRSGILLRTSWM